jgi:hypothetical protein
LHDATRNGSTRIWKKPTRFTASKPPSYRKPNKAISWFKDTANHIVRIRDLVAILQNHGISGQMLKTDRVGYVVYELLLSRLLTKPIRAVLGWEMLPTWSRYSTCPFAR